MKIIKDSLRELKHVVWPTREETKKYFLIILIFIVVFGAYLFIFNNIFSGLIMLLKDIFKS